MRAATTRRARDLLRMRQSGTRLVPVAAVAALLLAGCGGGSSAGETTSSTDTDETPQARVVEASLTGPDGCYVTVFLSESHTQQQQRQVRSLLLGNKLLRTVAYVPKELALRRLARTQPKIAAG